MIKAYDIDGIKNKILKMPKYRNVQVPEETVLSLIEQSLPLCKNTAGLEKMVREKIHNIVALYLGDIDYKKAKDDFRRLQNNQAEVKEFSQNILMSHASTKERGHELHEMYELIFRWTGEVKNIADLACGLHPCGLPFMNLPPGAAYYAYDLNKARAGFLNDYINGLGYGGGCFHQDIFIQPPFINFDLAFFFKEAHRLEKRQPGSLIPFLDSIKAAKVVVSLPKQSFGTRQQFYQKYESMMHEYTETHGWDLEIFSFNNEIFYAVDRAAAPPCSTGYNL